MVKKTGKALASPRGWTVSEWYASPTELLETAIVTSPEGFAEQIAVRKEDMVKGPAYVAHLKNVMVENAIKRLRQRK